MIIVDGVVFSRGEAYIVTGEFVDAAPYTSDYTYLKIYYRSIRERELDYLTAKDYIWRWDTDWFWCSKVFHVQNPTSRASGGQAAAEFANLPAHHAPIAKAAAEQQYRVGHPGC